MTKKTLSQLSDSVRNAIEALKADYKKETINRKETRARASGYVKALADAKIITEQERKVLFCYITV